MMMSSEKRTFRRNVLEIREKRKNVRGRLDTDNPKRTLMQQNLGIFPPLGIFSFHTPLQLTFLSSAAYPKPPVEAMKSPNRRSPHAIHNLTSSAGSQ